MSQSNNSIEDLKNQLNIVDVIGRVVPLKRAGSNYKGVCPFHNEKTPSFVVSEQKQIFTCFGCGASGNVIEFTKRYYNLEFKEACEKLGRENGIEINFSSSRDKYLEKYYEVNKEAARFFYRAMTETANRGYAYMKNRGLEDAILKKFGIGFADEKWDSLYNYFKDKGTDEKILLELGLISKSSKDGKYYDKFRNRVIFPILSTTGKVIGFGGRTIDGSDPKYLNSPENKVFQKKNNLYALNFTKQDMSKADYGILVEGYMDVISLYQRGVKNVGASLGTALTENQAKLLKRYTKNIVLSYDSDNAGRKAALRGIDILEKEGLKVKVLHVNDGKDPDEFIKEHGKTAFLELVENAYLMTDYKIQTAKSKYDLTSEEGKIDFINEAGEILKNLSPTGKDIYIKKIAKELSISEGALRMEVMGNNDGLEPKPLPVYPSREEEKKIEGLSNTEASIIKCLIVNPNLTVKLMNNCDILESPLSLKIFKLIIEKYGSKGDFHWSEILEGLSLEEGQYANQRLNSVIVSGNENQVFEQCVETWILEKKKVRRDELMRRLALADESINGEEMNRIMAELMELNLIINR